jgi:hypothetical protein
VEIIGRMIAAFLLMSLASLVGAVCALVVYLLLRRANRRSAKAYLVAGFFPPAVMGYLLACLILSSMLSGPLGTPDLVFGDINEQLPNGFTLEALDKMPEAGHIQKAGDSLIKVAWVGSVQVEDPYVLGKYDYTYFPRTEKEHDRNFFIFDTRTGEIRDYPSEGALAASSRISIHLTSTPYFHAPSPPSRRIWSLLFLLLAVVPPVALAISLVSKLVALLKAADASSVAPSL